MIEKLTEDIFQIIFEKGLLIPSAVTSAKFDEAVTSVQKRLYDFKDELKEIYTIATR